MRPLDYRIMIGWSFVSFFLALNGREWDDLPISERMAVHEFLATVR